jgi:hypothetical protein
MLSQRTQWAIVLVALLIGVGSVGLVAAIPSQGPPPPAVCEPGTIHITEAYCILLPIGTQDDQIAKPPQTDAPDRPFRRADHERFG